MMNLLWGFQLAVFLQCVTANQQPEKISPESGQRDIRLLQYISKLEDTVNSLKVTVNDLEQTVTEIKHDNHHDAKIQWSLPNPSKNNSTVITFTASANESVYYNYDATVSFKKAIVNIGNFYNPLTGVFTCGTHGYYSFSISIRAVVDHQMYAEIVVGQSGQVSVFASSGGDMASNTVVAECQQNQQVFVKCLGDDNRMFGSPINAYSTFTGTFLAQI